MKTLQIEALKQLLDKIDPIDFPVVKGKTVYIGRTIVRPSRGKWAVFDIKSNEMLAKTFHRHSAIALAKYYAKHKEVEQDILRIDHQLNKHYNDCLHFEHIINTSKDELRIDIAEMRYEISYDKSLDCKDKLDFFIF